MKRSTAVVTVAVSLIILILLGLSCVLQDTLDISVTELDNGVMVKNLSNVDCLVFVNSPQGEQQFELAVGQNTTVTRVSQPIEVPAVTMK